MQGPPVRIHLPRHRPASSQAPARPGMPTPGAAAGHLPWAATLPAPIDGRGGDTEPPPPPPPAPAADAGRPVAHAPGEQALRSQRSDALRQITRWAEKDAQAQAAGVDLRRKTFINKLISTGAALITLGVAVALSVATAGAATPLVAVAGVRAVVLMGDSLAAWIDWRRSTETPPRKLPLGANCLGNLLYGLATRIGVKDLDAAKQAARVGSGLITVGLASASLALGLPHEGLPLLATLLRYASNLGSMGGTAAQAKAADAYDDLAKARDRAKSDLSGLFMEVAVPSGMGAQAYQDWCSDLWAEFAAQGASPQTLETLSQIINSAWASVRDDKPVPSPVDADRSTLVQRLVNDVVGLHAGASFTLTAFTHSGVTSALDTMM